MHTKIGEIVKKEELKSLLTQAYNELLSTIDLHDKINKDDVATYLHDVAFTLEKMDDSAIDSIEHARLSFTEAYKSIAQKSISSYKETNGTFQKLTKMHEETLEDYKEHLIDLPTITEKFDGIQEHMKEEISRANHIIQNLSQQIKELEETTNLDSLTKVFNRRALDSYLEQVCQKGELKHELHLLILDIDDFKLVNDTFGHIAGDKVLILIANILRKMLREGDKIFRYGGEEFVIILNRINTQTCKKIAERIRHIIEVNQLIYKGESLKVTVSIGATKHLPYDTPETLISRADQALYISKKNGKNQINMKAD